MKRPHDYLDTEELLTQLAEEAGELVQAALKLRRVINGKNPTPMTYEEAIAGLREETADMMVCLDELFQIDDWDGVCDIKQMKLHRWVSRLEAVRYSNNGERNHDTE